MVVSGTVNQLLEFIVDTFAYGMRSGEVHWSTFYFGNFSGWDRNFIDRRVEISVDSNNIVTINANFYTPIDEVSIPTGEVAKVEGTPMDFTTPHTVGERINDKFQQLINGAGYDHCYVLNKIETGSLDLAATCFEPNSGRTMEVYTTEAGVQLYTGNWLNGFEGAHGATFPARSAICFEAQCFPDTPNKPHFPSATLLPGDEYQQVTIYKFGVEK